jgi:glutathione synthase/RimK-type ligase-like ATP-grasp enzyme
MKLFKPQIRTKNFSSDDLKARNAGLGEFAVRCIIRFGSRTSLQEAFPKSYNNRRIIEINTPQACHNSGDKVLMKECFNTNLFQVKTAEWMVLTRQGADSWEHFPAIIKHKHSCKGKGIYYVETKDQLNDFIQSHTSGLSSHIIERFYNFPKEYRLHVTKDGCFYTCRKMLRTDAQERWHRHDMNSVWIMEENPLFEKPSNWAQIEAECVKALNAVGLDVGACDVKVQSEKGRRLEFTPDFIILEINSAPSFGAVTLEKYRQKLPEIINQKIQSNGNQ